MDGCMDFLCIMMYTNYLKEQYFQQGAGSDCNNTKHIHSPNVISEFIERCWSMWDGMGNIKQTNIKSQWKDFQSFVHASKINSNVVPV